MIFNNNLNDYFAIILAIVATLNGIAIPLSYNIISVNLKPYLDKNISKIFLEEEDFKSNIIVSVWALPFFCFPLIFDIRTILALPDGNSLSIAFVNGYLILSFIFIAGFLISFISFSKMIYNYASNTEEIVFEKLKSEIDNYLED